VAIPSAALSYQWATRARNLTAEPLTYLSGCFIIATRALDSLTIEQQQVVRAASAKANFRVSRVEASMDEQLLNSLFAKQGVRTVALSPALDKEFRDASRVARERTNKQFLPPGLLERVEAIINEFRNAPHH
jgi:TRAP-type C4-dicarboxylate transport system substrate-binding protein